MGSGFTERVEFVHRLADAAGNVIRPHFRQRLDITEKDNVTLAGDFDPVTEADKGAEKVLRALIEETYPDDAILGEEYGERSGTSGYRWVLDPVDGTRAFIAGMPMWGTLIALEETRMHVYQMGKDGLADISTDPLSDPGDEIEAGEGALGQAHRQRAAGG